MALYVTMKQTYIKLINNEAGDSLRSAPLIVRWPQANLHQTD